MTLTPWVFPLCLRTEGSWINLLAVVWRFQNSRKKNTKQRPGCRCVFCSTQWMQRDTTSHLEHKNKRCFSVGIRWLGGKILHMARSIAQIYVGIVFNVLSHLYDFLLRIWLHVGLFFHEYSSRPATQIWYHRRQPHDEPNQLPWLAPRTFFYFFQPASLASFFFRNFGSFSSCSGREFAIAPYKGYKEVTGHKDYKLQKGKKAFCQEVRLLACS